MRCCARPCRPLALLWLWLCSASGSALPLASGARLLAIAGRLTEGSSVDKGNGDCVAAAAHQVAVVAPLIGLINADQPYGRQHRQDVSGR